VDPAAPALGTVIVSDPQPLSIARMIATLREGLDRRPMLFPVPEALIGLALTALGRGADRERLFGDLVASPAKLISLGWKPREPAAEALRAFAAARREPRIPEPPRP
jgi:UDP-glucose 4-epimerase